jgi:dTDP-4-dehydrorhamnose reductase
MKPKNIIVGATGLIGSALVDIMLERGKTVIKTYNGSNSNGGIKLDLRDGNFDGLCDSISENDNVYILSAYSNPSWVFENQEEAKRVNLIGTINFIKKIIPKSPRIIYMSSVEVFDGTKGGYEECDLPNPLNLYGAMKYQIECYLKEKYDRHTIVRTSWNVGLDFRSRCVVSLTYQSLLKAGAKMAVDNKFSITSVEDTAQGLCALGNFPEIKKIHICGDGVVSRSQIAELIIQNSKNSALMNFEPCHFSEISYSEPRGLINNMNNSLSKEVMGISYQNSLDVILKKIAIIDRETINL